MTLTWFQGVEVDGSRCVGVKVSEVPFEGGHSMFQISRCLPDAAMIKRLGRCEIIWIAPAWNGAEDCWRRSYWELPRQSGP